jgi:hypothetical protein
MKKICLISTLHHNVGDDFVREGIIWLVRQVLGEVSFDIVHKHFPLTVRGAGWDSLDRLARVWLPRSDLRLWLSRALDRLPVNPRTDRLLTSDWVIQSGAPVYWKNRYSRCSDSEWFQPLVTKRWAGMQPPVPLLNLGAGACLAPGSDGSEVVNDISCREFIQQLTSYAALTTVRDPLAGEILRQCGHTVPVLSCPSLFSPQAAGIVAQAGEFVALNYMAAGGHYDLAPAGPLLAQKWEATFIRLAREVASQYPCVMICHNRKELADAARLLPEFPRFYSTSWRDYLDWYSRCHFAIVNRVHGAMAAAALGKRVLLIGNDTRVLTADGVPGLKWLWVSDAVNADLASEELELLKSSAPIADNVAFIREVQLSYQSLLRQIT